MGTPGPSEVTGLLGTPPPGNAPSFFFKTRTLFLLNTRGTPS